MHTPEALILRRCYPVPVTFADLRCAADSIELSPVPSIRSLEAKGHRCPGCRETWTAALKEATSALDEVYAVVEGREIRVAVVYADHVRSCIDGYLPSIPDLLEVADRDGYWERPHEVRLDLQTRTISRDEVAKAVMVGQLHAERFGQ